MNNSKAYRRKPADKGRRFWMILLSASVCFLVFILLWLAAKDGYQYFYKKAYPTDYAQWVEQYSEEYDVPLSLCYAVIRTESSFDPDVTSSVGARGLMQIMEDTFDWIKYRKEDERDITFDDMYDPRLNLEYGIFMLKLLLEEFGSIENALCAYHAGWGNVKAWLSSDEYTQNGTDLHTIPFSDTDSYVKKVMDTMKTYQDLYDIQ